MKRSVYLALALLAVVSVLVSACRSRATPTPPEPAASPTAATPAPTRAPEVAEPTSNPTPTPGEVTVTIWHGWEGEYLTNIEAVFGNYMAQNAGVKVELVHVPDLANRIVQAIPAGEGPDVIAWANDQIGRIAEMGLIKPLSDRVDQAYMEANYEPVAVRAMQYKGEVWGLPESMETLTMIYNRALISEGELPRDTDELLAKAGAWMEEHPGQYYFVYNARNDVVFAAPWIYGAGGYFVDETPSVGLNTPGGLAGLELIARFREVMPEKIDHSTADTLFREGKAAIVVNGPWYLADMEKAGMDYGLAVLPIVSSSVTRAMPLVQVKCLMLTPNSKNPAAAVDVMKYYTGPQSLVHLAKTNRMIPANRLANAHAEVKTIRTSAAFVEQARLGEPMPTTPAMAAVWDPVAKMLESVWTGDAVPLEAVQVAQERAESNIRELGMEPQAPKEGAPPGLALEPGLIKEFRPLEVTGPVKITLWHAWPRQYRPAIQQVLDEYTEMNPNVTFELVSVQDMPTKVLEAVPAGEGPDIIVFANEWVGRLSEEGVIIPLDDYIDRTSFERTYIGPAVQAVTYKGQVWGFPDTAKVITLVYNKAKISQEDVPRGTDELLARGQRWMKDHPGEYLFVYNAKSDAYFSAPWWHAAGAYFVDEAGKVGTNTPEGLQAAEFIYNLRDIMPEEIDYGIADTLFREGKTAITMSGSWYLPGLERSGIDYGLAFIPTFSPTGRSGSPFVGVEALMVAANSQHPDVAANVLEWFTSRAAQVAMTMVNETVPTNKAALEDPQVKDLATVRHFATQASLGTAMPTSPFMSAMWDPMAKGLEAMWTRSATPEEAIELIQEQAEENIKEMQ